MSEALQRLEEYRSDVLGRLSVVSDISTDGIGLADAEAYLRQLKELTIELTGKKSRVAELKKEIGKVEADVRAEFAQAVQSIERDIRVALDAAESRLTERIATLKEERETLDVTIPGRRPRTGHLHGLTILRQK